MKKNNTGEEKIVTTAEVVIYCDGGSRGNPGPAASAFVVIVDGNLYYKEGKFLGINTNNVAEYSAVIMAVSWILEKQKLFKKIKEIIINVDSQLIERQINGFYKVKNIKLKELHNNVTAFIKEITTSIKIIWNYRTKNKLADELVNHVLDQQ